MDIFSRIDEQTQQQQESREQQESFSNIIVDEDGRYGYNFVADPTKQDDSFLFYKLPKGYQNSGFFARHRAKKFYNFLLKPIKDTRTQKQYEKELKRRTKKIEKFLKKGINFSAFFTTGMSRMILEALTQDEIKMLYDHGFDVAGKIAYLYAENTVFAKNIYYSIDYFTPQILKGIPTHMLEKLIHTRKGVSISEMVYSTLIRECYYCSSLNLSRNIQLLIKTGQITLTASEIIRLCEGLKNRGYEVCPEVMALKKFAESQTPKGSDGGEKKYSNQRHIETKTEKGKSHAQEMIDILFDNAQNEIK